MPPARRPPGAHIPQLRYPQPSFKDLMNRELTGKTLPSLRDNVRQNIVNDQFRFVTPQMMRSPTATSLRESRSDEMQNLINTISEIAMV